jgi:hypothetical protein
MYPQGARKAAAAAEYLEAVRANSKTHTKELDLKINERKGNFTHILDEYVGKSVLGYGFDQLATDFKLIQFEDFGENNSRVENYGIFILGADIYAFERNDTSTRITLFNMHLRNSFAMNIQAYGNFSQEAHMGNRLFGVHGARSFPEGLLNQSMSELLGKGDAAYTGTDDGINVLELTGAGNVHNEPGTSIVGKILQTTSTLSGPEDINDVNGINLASGYELEIGEVTLPILCTQATLSVSGVIKTGFQPSGAETKDVTLQVIVVTDAGEFSRFLDYTTVITQTANPDYNGLMLDFSTHIDVHKIPGAASQLMTGVEFQDKIPGVAGTCIKSIELSLHGELNHDASAVTFQGEAVVTATTRAPSTPLLVLTHNSTDGTVETTSVSVRSLGFLPDHVTLAYRGPRHVVNIDDVMADVSSCIVPNKQYSFDS